MNFFFQHEFVKRFIRGTDIRSQKADRIDGPANKIRKRVYRCEHLFQFLLDRKSKYLRCNFFQAQLQEREQERDDYESKINDMKELLERKSIQTIEKDDSALRNVIVF